MVMHTKHVSELKVAVSFGNLTSGGRSALCADSQLPEKGPTDLDDAPAPVC